MQNRTADDEGDVSRPGKRSQLILNRKPKSHVCTDTLVPYILLLTDRSSLRCSYKDMKINEMNLVAQRNEDMIACSMLLPAHSFCIVPSVQPCHEKSSKTQSNIHLQRSGKQSATLLTFFSCKRRIVDLKV